MTDHVLDRLAATIAARKDGDPESSYTARLLAAGAAKAAQKMGEEAIETVIAAVHETPDALAAESADLLYHLMVLWAAAGLDSKMVWQALERREGISGITEKNNRSTKGA